MSELRKILEDLKRNLDPTDANYALADALDCMAEEMERRDEVNKEILSKFDGISSSLNKVSASIDSKKSIDLRPLLEEIKNQNVNIGNYLTKPTVQHNFNQFENTIIAAVNSLKESNDRQTNNINALMQAMSKDEKSELNIEDIAKLLDKKQNKEWEFSLVRNRGNQVLEKIIAKSK